MDTIPPSVTGRKVGSPHRKTEPPPLLVDVREARRLLGNMSRNKFWAEVKLGKIQLVGGPKKKWAVVASLHEYVDELLRQQSQIEATRTVQVAS
jgi:hypothetical protein